jgi:hypothetical protein
MKKVLGSTLFVVALLFGTAGQASADHGYSQRDGCGESGGGCNNEREENYSGAGCKYVCPSFDKSPVQDSFNVEVCLPGATCHFGEKKGDQQPAQ